MTNPLLNLTDALDFSLVQAEHVEPAVRQLLAEAERALDAIAAQPAPSYQTTLAALERATEPLEHAMSVADHLEGVATTPEFRKAYNAILPDVSAFWSSIPLHAGLYRALSSFAKTPEAQALSGTRRRFLEKTLSEFKRHGAELSPAKKIELSDLDRRLSEITNRFSQNVLDATNAFELVVDSIEELAGLPESALAQARHSAEEKGISGYRFTLQAPSVTAVLTHADNRTLREKIWLASNQRATSGDFDNRRLVVEILELRSARAKLLGFQHFVDLVTEDRMAKDGATAAQFVEDLRAKTAPAFERENAELETFRRELEGAAAPRIEPWDVAYYAERARRARYAFDEEALRPYFPADDVLAGAFELGTRLFGIKVVEETGVKAWDKSVRRFRMQRSDGTSAGVFYVDLYPRENKRGGAWMHGIVNAVAPQQGLAMLCANATPPLGDRPALLTHREVETLFHEFGHLLHHCLNQVELRSLAGTRVAHDFVELPSQILENWCSEREGLALFARHYSSAEPLPSALFERLRGARTYRAANDQMRQLGLAALDLALHMDYDPARDGDVMAYARRVMQRYSPATLPESYALAAQFSHLFAHPVGYAAGYYAYKWAEVLDADAFGRFKEEGLFNRQVGQQFHDHILSRGDSEEPSVLFELFRGRKARVGALLERLGLQEPATVAS